MLGLNLLITGKYSALEAPTAVSTCWQKGLILLLKEMKTFTKGLYDMFLVQCREYSFTSRGEVSVCDCRPVLHVRNQLLMLN